MSANVDGLERAYTLASSLVHKAMDKPRMQRSSVYVEGMRAALLRHTYGGVQVSCRWQPGTTECDAFWAGVDEGNGLWRARMADRAEALAQVTQPGHL